MGKKKQARPGLDGIAPGSLDMISPKARRRAKKVTAKEKKKLVPGGAKRKGAKGAVAAVAKKPMTELEKLVAERKATAAKRQQRKEELAKAGELYQEPEADTNAPQVPPHLFKVSARKMVLYCEITLHRVPHQKINCELKKDGLHVDTLGHSKKWVLDMPYPDGILCDPKGIAEVSPAGVLGLKMKITHMPAEVEKREAEKQESIAAVKHLKFRKNRAGETITGLSSLGKRKAREAEEAKETQNAEGEGKKKKKKKTFVTDKDQALDLIEGIQNEEEPKKAQRKSMLDHVQDMKADRKERRVAKRAKKQTMESQAVKQIISSKKARASAKAKKALEEVKPLKAPTGRKVSFKA